MSKDHQPVTIDTTDFTWDVFPVKVVVRSGWAYLVQSGGIFKTYNPFKDASDLFIKFATLKTQEDIVNFINEWGPLFVESEDKDNSAQARDLFSASYSELGDNKFVEPRLYEYQQELLPLLHWLGLFKGLFKRATDEPTNDATIEQLNATILAVELNKSASLFIYKKPRKAPKLAIRPNNLYGAMLLQLYSYWASGKELRKCGLPSCNQLTTTKFCSPGHKAYYSMLRKRIKDNPETYLKRYGDVLDQLFEPEEIKEYFEKEKRG